MLCENCQKKEASIHVTDKVGDTYAGRHLCPDCAGALFNSSPEELIFSPLSVIKYLTQKIKEEHDKNLGGKKCPQCGCTWADFVRTGKVGCPHDYELFRAEIAPVLKKLQDGKFMHVGKIPPNQQEEKIRNVKIKVLESEMAEMVKVEKYENAARLRDEINQLKSE